MRVLVVESEPGAATSAIAELESAGHQVRRCHEPGAPAFPCVGLDPGRCPLEHDAIDVALTVRPRAHPRPSAFEDGITCALRRHLPVVVAGRTALNPFEQYRVTLTATDEIVAACEAAAGGRQPAHEEVGTGMLHQALARAGLPVEGTAVSVRRSGNGLQVTLRVPAETCKHERDIAAVRVIGAIRAFDRYAPGIEISCEELS
jgi:hypothetical protein